MVGDTSYGSLRPTSGLQAASLDLTREVNATVGEGKMWLEETVSNQMFVKLLCLGTQQSIVDLIRESLIAVLYHHRTGFIGGQW